MNGWQVLQVVEPNEQARSIASKKTNNSVVLTPEELFGVYQNQSF